MNNLNDYIIEKLKIGSKSKVNEKIKPQDAAELKREILKKIIDKETDFNDIDISAVKDLSHLFEEQNITEIDISEWDVSHVESMRGMFQNCWYLKTCGDLGKWKVDKCKDMSWMFNNCKCLTNIGDLDDWEIDGTKMKGAFQGCGRLKSIGNVYNWKPEEPNYDIFWGCNIHISKQPRKRV